MTSDPNDIKGMFKQYIKSDPKSKGKVITLEQITRWLQNGGIIDGKNLTKEDVEKSYRFKYGLDSDGLKFEEFEKFMKFLAKTKCLNYEEMKRSLIIFTLLPPTNLILEIRSGTKYEQPPCPPPLNEDNGE